MLVAFSTSNGIHVDKNLLELNEFAVWDINPSESYYVSKITINAEPCPKHEKAERRAEALRTCSIVYASVISGPTAARLIANGIHPMRTMPVNSVEDIVLKLQHVLKTNPPPWMLKAQWKQRLQILS
jgi:nitrogen fixation protein NifX